MPYVDNARFVDLETGEDVQVEPSDIRKVYRSLMNEKIDFIAEQSISGGLNISFGCAPYISALNIFRVSEKIFMALLQFIHQVFFHSYPFSSDPDNYTFIDKNSHKESLFRMLH